MFFIWTQAWNVVECLISTKTNSANSASAVTCKRVKLRWILCLLKSKFFHALFRMKRTARVQRPSQKKLSFPLAWQLAFSKKKFLFFWEEVNMVPTKETTAKRD